MSLNRRLERLEGKQVVSSVSIWDVICGEVNADKLDAEERAIYEALFTPEPVDEIDPIEAEIESTGMSSRDV
jgi:hypothetical protein